MLGNMLKAAAQRHKDIAQELICASEVTTYVYTQTTTVSSAVGSPLFADVTTTETYTQNGPFKCIWLDAASARASNNSIEQEIVGRYVGATVVAKFWLEDVLVDATDPYGATLFDNVGYVSMDGYRFDVLGYERYGLGTQKPYLISVVLSGTYASK